MTFWEHVKEDLKIGMKEGAEALKTGYEAVKEKTGELKDQGVKQYKLFTLKNQVKDEMAELGGRVYSMAKEKAGAITDPQAVEIIEKISKFEAEIEVLEKAK